MISKTEKKKRNENARPKRDNSDRKQKNLVNRRKNPSEENSDLFLTEKKKKEKRGKETPSFAFSKSRDDPLFRIYHPRRVAFCVSSSSDATERSILLGRKRRRKLRESVKFRIFSRTMKRIVLFRRSFRIARRRERRREGERKRIESIARRWIANVVPAFAYFRLIHCAVGTVHVLTGTHTHTHTHTHIYRYTQNGGAGNGRKREKMLARPTRRKFCSNKGYFVYICKKRGEGSEETGRQCDVAIAETIVSSIIFVVGKRACKVRERNYWTTRPNACIVV